MRISQARRNAMLDTLTSAASAGKLRIYTGSRPADPDTAIGAVTLLAELTMNATAFGASSGGVLTANAITSDASADATGTAGWARLWQSNGTTPIIDLTVTATGGGGEVQFSTTSFVATNTVSLSSFTITLAVGA
jgi:hypothetical protein